jgi:hypothetical protein
MPIVRVTMLRVNSKRHNYHGYVVSKVVGVDIAYVPCPTDIAPSMAATMDVNPRPSRNDSLDVVVRRGTSPQIQV